MSLRLKLLLPLVLLALLMGAYIQFAWAPRACAEAEQAQMKFVGLHLDSVVEGMIPLLLGNQLDIVYENLGALRKTNTDWTRVELLHPRGSRIYPFGADAAAEPKADVRRVEKPIRHLDINLGKLVVAVDMAPTFAKVRRQANDLSVMLLTMLGVIFTAVALVVELAVRQPLSILAEATRKLAAEDYQAPLPRVRGSEVGTLVASFAQMREELQRQQEELRDEHARLLEEVRDRERAEADVRDLNQTLEQRVARRTADLEAANKDLEAFSYSVSHDLRAPLRAIHGYAQIVADEYRDKLDEEGRRYLDSVCANTARMDKLIDDILGFLRLGRQELTAEPINMARLAQEVADELLAALAPGRKAKVEVGNLPPASGDPAMIRQVFVNLLSNALKFSATREQALIEVRGSPGPAANEYEVRDNGVGFDMAYAGKLFGEFQRLHSAKDFEGSGVGLAIVKRIVARHGGEVRAEGKPDAGATMCFTLPRLQGGR